jgi:hypothetical protein
MPVQRCRVPWSRAGDAAAAAAGSDGDADPSDAAYQAFSDSVLAVTAGSRAAVRQSSGKRAPPPS